MFEGIEKFIVITAVVLWFAQGWYLNEKLKAVHAKLDTLTEAFDGLRDYLYENDRQFDDERQLLAEFGGEGDEIARAFAGKGHFDLIKEKERQGRRTLSTPFVDRLR